MAIKTNFFLSVMSGHQLRMTHHENSERNVFDHYADKSFLAPIIGICVEKWYT